MSGLGPKADIAGQLSDVRFGSATGIGDPNVDLRGDVIGSFSDRRLIRGLEWLAGYAIV
jgi:hypothetical protein